MKLGVKMNEIDHLVPIAFLCEGFDSLSQVL